MDEYGFIYITTNKINGKRYIGKKVYDRDGRWKNYLGSGTALANAINVYGRENFSREIIDVAATDRELCEKEKQWISFYDAVKDKGFYNIAPGGDGGNVRSGYTAEALALSEKKRLSAVHAAQRYGENSPLSKLTEEDVKYIIQRLLDNEFTSDIAADFGVAYSTVADIREHKTWKHLTDGIVFSDISKRKRHPGKPVIAYTKQMGYVGTYASARDAEAALGVGYRLISQVCTGEKKSAHGYIFQFAS